MNDNKVVLLVHPEISRTKYNFSGVIDNEPLELEYIYTLLRKEGFDPYIWDGQVETDSLYERLRQLNPFCVYVCGRTRQENFMKEYCKAAKDICNSITIVGGIHVQHNYKRFFCGYIDYILTSFDIFRILDIIYGRDISSLDSICYRIKNRWKVNTPAPFDIKKLPLPDRTCFYQHKDRYRYLELFPCAHVRTSYCCPYRCKFCSRNSQNCGVYTVRDISDVIDEIMHIDCENIYIIDDDFLFNERRICEFIKLIKYNNIHKKFVCYGRADFIAAHEKLMSELKEIGFYYILVGLEATDDKHLESYNKKTIIQANSRAVKILNNIGINIMGMFIVDLDFTGKDFRDMYRWIKKKHITHAAVSIFTPEMSSDLFEEYRCRLITHDPSHWDYLHVVAKPSKLSVRMYYMHYHILLVKLFIRGWRDGIYDFLDYGFYIRSMIKNLFHFGG